MKNILLIVVDTLRPDHLGCYGYHRPTSPHLDQLASQSTVLESLWSASNFTAPAFTSLFTGLYPHQHGVFDFMSQAPSSAIHQLLQHNKVKMGGVVTFRFFKNLLSQIWGEVEAVTDTRSFDYSKDLPMAVTESSLAWLRKNREAPPFCLFVHYDGPHLPFRLPDEYTEAFDSVPAKQVAPEFLRLFYPQEWERLNDAPDVGEDSMFQLIESINWGKTKVSPETRRWLVDKYDASILYNDHAIGELLDGLGTMGLADDTIIAVLSDHGEEFMEHGNLSHGGIHLHEEIIRTVGIIHDPSSRKNQKQPLPVSQTDIMPTLCALAGANDFPETFQQQNLGGLVLPEVFRKPEERPVFCHGKSKIAVRKGPHKLIRTQPSSVLGFLPRMRLLAKMLLRKELGHELYNLEQDPLETRKLSNEKSIRKNLDSLLDEHLKNRQGTLFARSADDEERRRIEQEMKDLGYM